MFNRPFPFCDPCSPNVCDGYVDSSCVIYHFGNPLQPSRLINLNLPNGSSVQTILDAIDAALGSVSSGPITPISTNAVKLTATGPGNRTISASLIISAASGNTAVINNDGLFVPFPANLYKVQVDPAYGPYYLEDALIGGTDGIVSLSFEPTDGVLFGLPSISLPSLINGITSDETLINDLTSSVLNTLLTNQAFLTDLTDAVENQILNDSQFLTNLTQAIINNGSSFALLCNALPECSGSPSGCTMPSAIDASIIVTGPTVTLNIAYTAASPSPSNGYIVRYRIKGSSGSYVTTGDETSNPIDITGLTPNDYEGFIKSDCGGGLFSPEVAFSTSNYNNVGITSEIFGTSITAVTGIAGFTFTPIVNTGSEVGHQTGFTGTIGVTITGTVPGGVSLFLSVNETTVDTIPVSSAGTYTFPSRTYAPTDEIEIIFQT